MLVSSCYFWNLPGTLWSTFPGMTSSRYSQANSFIPSCLCSYLTFLMKIILITLKFQSLPPSDLSEFSLNFSEFFWFVCFIYFFLSFFTLFFFSFYQSEIHVIVECHLYRNVNLVLFLYGERPSFWHNNCQSMVLNKFWIKKLTYKKLLCKCKTNIHVTKVHKHLK